MIDLRKRSSAIEIMDDLNCSGDVVNQTLHELDVINRLLGGNVITLAGVDLLLKQHQKNQPFTIADLGCGSGDILKILATHLRKQNIDTTFTGIDANPHIIAYARQHIQQDNIQFKTADVLHNDFKASQFDIIIGTLFFHHFSTGQLILLLKQLNDQAKAGIVINDLHRHWLAYYSIKFLTKLFSKSSMVKYDAPLSVARGFRKAELQEILRKAGIEHYQLKWKWAFRWQLVIFKR